MGRQQVVRRPVLGSGGVARTRPARTDAAAQRLAEVFDGSYRRLVVQLYGVTGDLGEAEDVVQESFVRAAATGDRLLRVDNPEAWLRTVAVNLHRNRLRKLRGAVRARATTEAGATGPVDLSGLEDHLDVVAALRSLPASQREVLALHYLSDLGLEAIADTLHVPVGTVKSRLARGRAALAVMLGEVDGHD